MPLTIGTQIVTNRIPVQGLIAEQSATALATPVEGLMWHDTANKAYKIYLNGAWMTLGAAGQSVADGDKGDITVSSSGTVWTIDPSSITSAKIVDGTITLADCNASMTDQAVATASLRTLGLGAQQALAGTTRLDQLAAPTAAVSLNNQLLTNVQAPVSSTDAANKLYVDNSVQGLDAKASVKCATTTNLSGFIPAPASVDGITIANGDRVLVKDQTSTATNGIYVMSGGNLVRANDMYGWTQFPSAYTWVERGTVNADTGWVCTVDQGGTLETTPVTWTQFSGAGSITPGTGITKSGNTISLDTAYTDTTYANVSGDTFTGLVTFNGGVAGNTQVWAAGGKVTSGTTVLNNTPPSANNDLTRKDYVDGQTALGLKKGGDTTTGTYLLTGLGSRWKVQDSTLNLNTHYRSDSVAFTNSTDATTYASLGCDPGNNLATLFAMAGYTLQLNAPKVTVSQNPATATEVANKAYVDAQVGTPVRKYNATLGAMTAGAETVITHGLGTTEVIAQFRDATSNYEILFGWRVISTTQIGVTPDVAYAANAVKVVVIG